MSEEGKTLLERLKEECGTSPWVLLQAHYKRGALVYLDPSLDILEVGVAVIEDDKSKVEQWVNQKKMTPFPQMLADSEPLMKCLVAQPWVLAQEVS